MRLYRVESFYVFLLRFCSEGSEEEGWPTTASPHARPATHGQAAAKAPYKGWQPPAMAAPTGGSAARRHGRLQPARRGGSCLQRGARKGLPPAASPAASRGGYANRSGGCPLAGRLPAGKGNDDDDDGGAEGERWVTTSFGEKD
ncbi:hypothetical protein BHE74_00057027, partial [Ensete ventricosum]